MHLNLRGTALGLAVGALAAVVVSPAEAQDVEWLSRGHGTEPPPEYYRVLEENPGAYTFARAWKRRGPAAAPGQAGVAGQGPLAARAVQGTLEFPVVLGLFSDSPETAPHSTADVQGHFFDGPNPTGTITEFYAEQSSGLLNLTGASFPWQRATLTLSEVAGGVGGLNKTSGVGEYIVELLTALDDGTVDWGRFDNDGPDGVPNSGDDDGYVDVLAVLHPSAGRECNGSNSRIHSHRWQLRFMHDGPYRTRTPSARGGFILVDDYTIQPVVSCDGQAINEIGVFAHELGHGLGLPDLYATAAGSQHGAVGRWGLMGSGSWGCRGGNAARPCHMGAWSKVVLGWVAVETLPAGGGLGRRTLEPVETSARIYRIDSGDGTNEFFLLENRQPLGFDQEIYSPGMLVWHIDQDVLDARWSSNSINNDPQRMGVWIRAADGLNQAADETGSRGDAGDPWPGATANVAFHAGSVPASFSHDGSAMGVTLLDIALAGADVTFDAVVGYQTLRVTSGGNQGNPATVSVDGGPATATDLNLASAPFQTHTLEASAGRLIAPGTRHGFLSWEDGSPRIRTFTTLLSDSVLVATYGGQTEVLLDLRLVSPWADLEPGSLEMFPVSVDGWFDQGQDVSITAVPRTGFAFAEWSGDLAGSPNPVSLTLDGPVTATAHYDVIFGVGGSATPVPVEAAVPSGVELVAENGNLPVTWSLDVGPLPAGLALRPEGTLDGSALESGTFPVTVGATDAIGLQATAQLEIQVSPPTVARSALTAPFFGQGLAPTDLQRQYLDRNGNANGSYDLGDFRAFVLDNPGLVQTGRPAAKVTPARVVVPLTFQGARRP